MWQDEFDCPRCREWQGKPPISIEENRQWIEQSLREEGLDPAGMRLEHGCRIGIDSLGEAYHIPATIMILGDRRIEWLPEQPA